MPMPVLLVVLCALPGALAAQSLTSAEAETLPRLIQSICIDVHDNIGCETIVLLESETQPDTADLLVLSDHRDGGTPLAVARNVVFNGALWGMAPWVEERQDEGFLIQSEQIGAGRHPWMQTLTVVWRNERFVISGYTFSSYDRIQNDSYSCDVNLRTGDFTSEVVLFDTETEEEEVTRRAGTGSVIDIALTDWATQGREPEACRPEAEIYYNH